MVCGTLKGKGVIYRASLASAVLILTAVDATTFTVNATAGVATITPPTGGVGQFKGLT